MEQIIWTTEKRRAEELSPAPYNPRKWSDKDTAELTKSLERFNLADPIVINQNNTIIGGHFRLHILKQKGLSEVDVRVPSRLLTEHEEKELNLRLNRNLGQFDFDLLANFDEDMLKDVGFASEELDKIFQLETKPEDDEVPEARTTDIKLGDLFKLGEHRLLCGDATKKEDVEKLMNGQKADMVFTDPPYGIDFKSEKGKKIKGDDLESDEMMNFNNCWQRISYQVVKDDCFMMVWQSPRFFHLLNLYGEWKLFRLYTMYKSNRISFPHGAWINKTEPCLIFTKGEPKISEENYLDDCFVYVHDKESHKDSNVGHPTPKPVTMVSENIRAVVKEDNSVLDLFGGSGSTLIACEQLNRICYMMEIDPVYVQVIIDRWEKFTGKKAEKINGAG